MLKPASSRYSLRTLFKRHRSIGLILYQNLCPELSTSRSNFTTTIRPTCQKSWLVGRNSTHYCIVKLFHMCHEQPSAASLTVDHCQFAENLDSFQNVEILHESLSTCGHLIMTHVGTRTARKYYHVKEIASTLTWSPE